MVRTRQIDMADEIMDGVIGRISERLSTGKALPSGISTGLADLDEQLGKMHPGDLIILAGRPGMGKTALSLHLAHRSLRRDAEGFEHPARCAFFSLEMDADPLAHRVMSMAARAHRMGVVPYRNIRKGRIGQGEAATLKAAVAKLPKTVAWHTTGDLSLDEITAGCRQASRKLGGLDLVIIDYLQLIRFDIGRGENTASAIGRITKGLKALAKELSVPIVCLSQLSREVEHRDNKRPQLADLRDSGAIEQDADAVIFVYRDEYYLAKEEPKGGPGVSNARWHEWQNDLQGAKGVVELIAAKVRQGRPGTVKVYVEFETNTVVADKRELQEERMI
jgi:replicative DNA helicase